VTGELLALAVVSMVALGIMPFVLDRLERGTVSPPAMVRHVLLNRRSSPEVAEQLVAVLLDEAVAEVFAGRRPVAVRASSPTTVRAGTGGIAGGAS
jgi:hypothetical protein